MNRHAASAQIESEDVDAVSVFITGDRDSSARNAKMDDLTVFASIIRKRPTENTSYGEEGGGQERRTVCGLPHLAELFRQLYLDRLPNKIPQDKCEY